jgi:hypothetical protein
MRELKKSQLQREKYVTLLGNRASRDFVKGRWRAERKHDWVNDHWLHWWNHFRYTIIDVKSAYLKSEMTEGVKCVAF